MRYELNKLTLLPTCGFIARLVEHHTGIAGVMGSNPFEALIYQASLMITLDFHLQLQFTYELFHIIIILHISVISQNTINIPKTFQLLMAFEFDSKSKVHENS